MPEIVCKHFWNHKIRYLLRYDETIFCMRGAEIVFNNSQGDL